MFDFADDTELDYLYIHGSNSLDSDAVTKMANCNSIEKLQIGWGYCKVFNLIGDLENCGVKNIELNINCSGEYDCSNFYIPSTCLSFKVNDQRKAKIAGAKLLNCPESILSINGTNLNYFSMNCLEGLNSGILKDLTLLTNVYINYSDLNTIDFAFTNKIVTIELRDNNISNLENITKLKSCTSLTLSSNPIYDTSAGSNGGTIRNMEILRNLNYNYGKGGSLRNLYVDGCKYITDFSALYDEKCIWNSKSGF